MVRGYSNAIPSGLFIKIAVNEFPGHPKSCNHESELIIHRKRQDSSGNQEERDGEETGTFSIKTVLCIFSVKWFIISIWFAAGV